MEKQAQERGFTPLPLEFDLLLKRVKDGGYSGYYLGRAFLSSYGLDTPFNETLSGFMKLDAEGQRLFHEIMHIRLIAGWSDAEYYDLAEKITVILGNG
ncbi:MAG: hypothetical protein ABL924_13205 [Methyloglobulus sp.]